MNPGRRYLVPFYPTNDEEIATFPTYRRHRKRALDPLNLHAFSPKGVRLRGVTGFDIVDWAGKVLVPHGFSLSKTDRVLGATSVI